MFCSSIRHTPSGIRMVMSKELAAVVLIIMLEHQEPSIPIYTHRLAIIHLPQPSLALTLAILSCRHLHPSLCPTLPSSIYRQRRPSRIRIRSRKVARARTIIATLPALSQTLKKPMGQQLLSILIIINSHIKEAAIRQPPSRSNRSHREATVANSDATIFAKIV